MQGCVRDWAYTLGEMENHRRGLIKDDLYFNSIILGTISTLKWRKKCVQAVKDEAEKTGGELQYSQHKRVVTSTINGDKHGGNVNGDKTLNYFGGRIDIIPERLGGNNR